MAQEILKKHTEYYTALDEYGRKRRMLRKAQRDFVGSNPCPTCPKWSVEQPCEEREECRIWKHYCFRRAIDTALEIKHTREAIAYARSQYFDDFDIDENDWSMKDKIYF